MLPRQRRHAPLRDPGGDDAGARRLLRAERGQRRPVQLRPRRRRLGAPLRPGGRDRRFVQLDGARDHHLRPLPERQRRLRRQAAPPRARRTTARRRRWAGGAADGAARGRAARRRGGGTTGAAVRRAAAAPPARAAWAASRRCPGRAATRSSPSTQMNQFTQQPERALLPAGGRRRAGGAVGGAEQPVDALPPGLRTASTWVGTATDGWAAGKTLHYTDRHGRARLRGRHQGGAATCRRSTSPPSATTTPTPSAASASCASTPARPATDADRDARLEPHRGPARGGREPGPRGDHLDPGHATWSASGFIDESTGAAYDPARYPNHGTGLFFVGVEANGIIYGYALDHVGGGFHARRDAVERPGRRHGPGVRSRRRPAVGVLRQHLRQPRVDAARRSSAAASSPALLRPPGDAARLEQRRHRVRARERVRRADARASSGRDDSNFGGHALRDAALDRLRPAA